MDHRSRASLEDGVTPQTRADRLFRELDGREIQVENSRYTVYVLRIYMNQDDVWLQLSLGGKAPSQLVARLSSRATVWDVTAALHAWLTRSPFDRPHILHVR